MHPEGGDFGRSPRERRRAVPPLIRPPRNRHEPADRSGPRGPSADHRLIDRRPRRAPGGRGHRPGDRCSGRDNASTDRPVGATCHTAARPRAAGARGVAHRELYAELHARGAAPAHEAPDGDRPGGRLAPAGGGGSGGGAGASRPLLVHHRGARAGRRGHRPRKSAPGGDATNLASSRRAAGEGAERCLAGCPLSPSHAPYPSDLARGRLNNRVAPMAATCTPKPLESAPGGVRSGRSLRPERTGRLAAARKARRQRVWVRALNEDADVNAEVECLEGGLRRVCSQAACDRVRLTARVRETVQMPRNLGLRGRHQREGPGKDAGEYNSAHLSSLLWDPLGARILPDRRYAQRDTGSTINRAAQGWWPSFAPAMPKTTRFWRTYMRLA